MDDDLPIELWLTDPFWLFAPISPTRQISAFVPYRSQPAVGSGLQTSLVAAAASQNVNKRVIEYWRNHCCENKEQGAAEIVGREKCHRHMLNERLRREKERRGYSELHSMLPNKTKNDKNSIVKAAAKTIEELKACEEMLKKRNIELEMAMAEKMKRVLKEEGTISIRVALANPSSGINSMLSVLDVLKSVGVKANAIHATLLDSHFSAELAIQTHMRGADVERALQLTLSEAEKKFRRQCQEGSNGVKESSNFYNNKKWGSQGKYNNLKF